jgi:hypothetical protein
VTIRSRDLTKAATAFAVAGAMTGGLLADPAAAATSSIEMLNRNITGSVSGPGLSCSNYNVTSTDAEVVPLGTSYMNPVVETRWVSCTSGSSVVKATLHMRGSYDWVNGNATEGRDYRLYVELQLNGRTYACGYGSTYSNYGGAVITSGFPRTWSQLRRSIGHSTSNCGGTGRSVSAYLDFSEGHAAF